MLFSYIFRINASEQCKYHCVCAVFDYTCRNEKLRWINVHHYRHKCYFIVCSFSFLCLKQKYEFFVALFYRSVEGQPSNSKIVQTFEDGKWTNRKQKQKLKSPSFTHCNNENFTFHQHNKSIVPSAPPDNVQTGMLNLTAGWVCASFLFLTLFVMPTRRFAQKSICTEKHSIRAF